MAENEIIKTEVSNHIMTITFNRPDRMNAFTSEMYAEFLRILDQVDNDDEIRAVIVTGEGRAFCAGADLRRGKDTFVKEVPIDEHRDRSGLLSLRIYDLKKPIIAAINGPAVGVGITMTLGMDIRIASANAKMGFVFSRRGITPEGCSGWFLPRLVGISKALEWVMSGRVFSAQEALEGGLVTEVTEPESLLETAYQLASEIAEHTSATSVALSRQLMWRMLGADHPMESHRVESKLMHWSGRQPDAREGVTSFLEKRRANFTMKVTSDLPDFYPWWKERPFKA